MRTPWLAITALCAGLGIGRVGSGDEPPLQFELQLDGQAHTLHEGREATLQVGGKELTARITVAPTRRFEAGGLAFDYPRFFAFEYEEDAELGLESWTLDGNDVVAMVFAFAHGDADPLAQTMLENMSAALRADGVELREAALQLGARRYAGHACDIDVGGATIRMLAVGLTVDGAARVLVLQDSGDDDGGPSQELAQVRELLAKTFAITKG